MFSFSSVIIVVNNSILRTHTHTHPFNGPFSGSTQVSRYQKGKTNLDFTGARDSEWQWHQLGHMQVCTLLQTDNHASTPPLSFLQARCPSCCPTNSVKALKAIYKHTLSTILTWRNELILYMIKKWNHAVDISMYTSVLSYDWDVNKS